MSSINHPDEPYSTLFNNLKGFLIFLVVLGHLIEEVPLLYHSLFGSTIHKLIYSFHMEAFVFISGYYSKNVSNKLRTQLKQNIFPYFCLMFYVSFILGLYENTLPQILIYPVIFPFLPAHSSWYFLSLFFYRRYLIDIRKNEYYLPFSIVVAILIGLLNINGSILSFGRTMSFLPFFLIGYNCNSSNIPRIRNMKRVYILILFTVFLVLFLILSSNYKSEFFFLRDSFVALNVDPLLGIMGRACLILASLSVITLLIHFIKNTPSILTKIGRHSLSVYFFHLFFVYFLRHKEYFSKCSETTTLLILTVYAFTISFLLSRDKVYNTLQYVLRR